MSILRSCQHGLSAPPLMFWASVFLILLAKGVCSTSDEQMDYYPYRTVEPAAELQKVYPFIRREPFVFNYLRSLLQKEQQGELSAYDAGSDLSENSLDKNKFPPFINRLRAITSRINIDKDKISKKESYMSVCHFKVCNMG